MKKRFLLFVLAAAMLLSLSACKQEPQSPADEPDAPSVQEPAPEVFPNGTVICGVDISDMTAQEAAAAVEAHIADYSLTLQLGDSVFEFNNEILKMNIGTLDYEALLESGKALIGVILRNKGGANKDLKKFTAEIEKLVRKWDRE